MVADVLPMQLKSIGLFVMEENTGPDGLMYSVFTRPDLALVVGPWPFDLKEFKLTYEFRTVSFVKLNWNLIWIRLILA